MMNRSVMQRQMFAKGGAAGFPDLTRPGGGPPDGKITQADILQGRGVKLMEQGARLRWQLLSIHKVVNASP